MSASTSALPFVDPRALLENVLDSSTEYSFIATDPMGKILLWNEGARRIYGYPSEEAIGKDSRMLSTPDEIATGKADEVLQAAQAQGKWEGIVQRRRANGEEFPARMVLTILRDSSGEPQGYLIVSKDISEEVRLNHRLAESEEYNRGLIGASVDALMTMDTLGIITDVNTRVEELTGRPRQQLVGTELKDYFTDPARAEDGFRRVLATDRLTKFELTLKTASGQRVDAEFNATTFRGRDGKLRGVLAAARDVTEHNRLAAELRESQNYTRGLIETSLDSIVTVDLEGLITDVNEQMTRATGIAKEELLGTSFDACFTDPVRARAGVRLTLEKGFVADYDLSLKTKNGRDRTVSFNAVVFRRIDGTVQGIFASARDVTDQRELDAQLRESRNYNRSLIEASPDALFVIDPRFTITDLNEQMAKITGFGRDELIGTMFKGYFTDPARAVAAIRQTLDAGFLANFELTLKPRTGGQRLVSLNASTYGDADGAVKGVIASARDITEQKELESRLREAQNYNRGLVESNIDGLMTTDLLGRITDVNKQMETLSGLAREQLIGLPLKNLVTEPAKADDAIRRVMRENRVNDYELRIRTPTGGQTDVWYNAATVRDTSGRLQGIIAAARDVTEQKRLREQLEARNRELELTNKKVQEATRLKSEFLASMSHELRTPLNSIIGFSDFLLSQEDSNLKPEQREYLGDILNSGNHLLQLINDVLDLARVESGKVELNPERFSPARAVDEVCSVLKPLVSEKRLRLKTEVDATIGSVSLDPLRFKQILYNLLSNAVKFTPDGGTIEVRVSPNGEGQFALRVSDTGIGILPEDIPRLFREFEQLDVGPGGRYTGSGLGLSLTKKLVRLHGGSVGVSSKFGEGSTFTVLLPYRFPPEDPEKNAAPVVVQ